MKLLISSFFPPKNAQKRNVLNSAGSCLALLLKICASVALQGYEKQKNARTLSESCLLGARFLPPTLRDQL